jgi:hypothetical protein
VRLQGDHADAVRPETLSLAGDWSVHWRAKSGWLMKSVVGQSGAVRKCVIQCIELAKHTITNHN